MTQYTLTIDGEEWTVGSAEAPYDATHAVAGALLAGAEEVTVEKREKQRWLHTDEEVKDRIAELRSTLDDPDDDTADDDDRPICHDCRSHIDHVDEPPNAGHPVCPKCGGNPLPPVGGDDDD